MKAGHPFIWWLLCDYFLLVTYTVFDIIVIKYLNQMLFGCGRNLIHFVYILSWQYKKKLSTVQYYNKLLLLNLLSAINSVKIVNR